VAYFGILALEKALICNVIILKTLLKVLTVIFYNLKNNKMEKIIKLLIWVTFSLMFFFYFSSCSSSIGKDEQAVYEPILNGETYLDGVVVRTTYGKGYFRTSLSEELKKLSINPDDVKSARVKDMSIEGEQLSSVKSFQLEVNNIIIFDEQIADTTGNVFNKPYDGLDIKPLLTSRYLDYRITISSRKDFSNKRFRIKCKVEIVFRDY
jgi:hypothetical protein